jgi:hypothetical protein
MQNLPSRLRLGVPLEPFSDLGPQMYSGVLRVIPECLHMELQKLAIRWV